MLGLSSPAPSHGTAAAAPAPTNFQGDATGVTSIRWSWDPSTGATAYVLHDENHQTIKTLDFDQNEFEETGLSENTAYIRHVHARESLDLSPESNTVTRYTLVEEPVTSDFTVTAISATSIQIDVVSPPPHPFDDHTGVLIFRTVPTSKDVSGFAPVYIANDTGLAPNTEHCFNIRFRNGDGIPTGPSPSVNCATTLTQDEGDNFNIHDIKAKVSTVNWRLSTENVEKEKGEKDPNGALRGVAVVKLDSTKKDNIVAGFFALTTKVTFANGSQGAMNTLGPARATEQLGPVNNKDVIVTVSWLAEDIAKQMRKDLNALKATLVSNPNMSMGVGWVFCGEGIDPAPGKHDEVMEEPPTIKDLTMAADADNPGLFKGEVEHTFADPDKGVIGHCQLKVKAVLQKKEEK